MHAFGIHELIADAEMAGQTYREFLRVPDFSALPQLMNSFNMFAHQLQNENQRLVAEAGQGVARGEDPTRRRSRHNRWATLRATRHGP